MAESTLMLFALRSPNRKSAFRAALACAVLATLWVTVLSIVTNEMDIQRFRYDCIAYIDMAEHAVGRSLVPTSPWAYRIMTPALARALTLTAGLSTYHAFAVVAHLGTWLQLLLVFLFARHALAAPTRVALIVTLICGLQYFNVKYYVFDVYRPDHLAQPAMLAAWWAILCRRFTWAALICAVGVLDREFMLVPAALVSASLASEAWRTRSRARGLQWALTTLLVALAFALPRLLISTQASTTLAAERFNGSWLAMLVGVPLGRRRLVNLAFSAFAYALPIWLLWTRESLPRLAAVPKDVRHLALGHTFLVLGLALYGGTDLPRFIAYLEPVVILALVTMLREDSRKAALLAALVALAIFNRTFWQVPNVDVPSFVDFYAGWDMRVAASARRTAEAVALIAACWLVARVARRKELLAKPSLAA